LRFEIFFMSFVHLHCHSHYSLLDGLSKIEPLVQRAQALGMTAVALTDHGTLYGTIEFYNACHEAGIKPIVGMEAYIAPRSMHDKEGKIDADYYHLTLLAASYEGYKNLMLLSTLAHTEGYYYKPRIDKQTLKKYSKGLIALSGCQSGEMPRAVIQGEEQAARTLAEYLDIFGPDNFALELQRNARDPEMRRKEEVVNQHLLRLAKHHGLLVVATGDSHYVEADDAQAQDVLVCIGTGRTVDDENRLDMRMYELSLKSPEVMTELFADIPEAVSNTELIANRCSLEIPINQRYFATVEVPVGSTPEAHLEQLVYEQAKAVYGTDTGELSQDIKDRIAYELSIIKPKGYAPYFLMVADIVAGAHSIGAITNTRGSAAGSIVGHILNISAIDPVYYQLPFERFLTMSRPTPPDVDLDISDNRRDETIEWISQRYGKDKVAQIITFGTMMARAAVRDVGRALGVAYGKCDRIAKMIPIGKQGFHMTIEKALAMNPELKDIYERDPETKQIITIAQKLEGGARHASIHAAAIAITPTPLTDYTPLQKEPDGERLITQYDMYSLDVSADSHAIGVIKMDLLGIRNLSILEEAIQLVEQRHTIKVSLAHLPQPDPKTMKLLADGYTFGVFQLGSSGMTRYLKELKPKDIFDIMAMIALYRPGPMGIIPEYVARRHDPRKVTFFDPRMKEYLERSLGLLVYQDDVLLTAINIAGYSWEEADKLRKAMGKKIPEEMAKQKVKFIAGCVQNGMSQLKSEELFKLIEPFAAYGFGKAHAASYAQVSYQTAYMKANFPVEFMAAVMTAESGDEEKIYAAVEECEQLGIKVLPPDVNESLGDFTVVDATTIRFGLNAIKNLGSDVITKIIETRRQRQSGNQQLLTINYQLQTFKSLDDFLASCYTKNLNKKSWEALVKSGALDRFGERGQLLANTESVLEFLREQVRQQNSDQTSLFGAAMSAGTLQLKTAPPATKDDMLAWEKEHLGMYVSAHPLDNYQAVLKNFLSIKDLSEDLIDHTVTIGGIISKLKRTLTKKNDPMAFFTLEDYTGNLEVLVFPKIMPQAIAFLNTESIIEVTGRLSEKDGEFKLIADHIASLPKDELYQLALAEMEKSKQVVIHMNQLAGNDSLQKIKKIIETYPGNAQVFLNIGAGLGAKKIKTKSQVRITNDLIAALKKIPEVSMVGEK
jgi:DNA polymerase III subunit alpha